MILILSTSKPSKHNGFTLVIALIMLLIITLVSITAFKLSNQNLQIVGNMQLRNQTIAVAQGAIETTISKPTFSTVPNIAVTTYASVGGSSTNDIKIVTTPTCVSIQPIPNAALNASNPNDAGCLVGANQQSGVVGSNTINSLCSNSLWNIQSVATDQTTNTQTILNQGVALRVSSTTTCP